MGLPGRRKGAFYGRLFPNGLEQDAAHARNGKVAPSVMRSKKHLVPLRGKGRSQHAEAPWKTVAAKQNTHLNPAEVMPL